MTPIHPVRNTLGVAGLTVASIMLGWIAHGYWAVSSSPLTREAFENIYKDATWGANAEKVGSSGPGSTLESTFLYRKYLEKFLKDAEIRSVVDAGCGDWEFSQAIDWTGIDYKGFDIVPAVIEEDKKKYGKPHIQFFVGNIVTDDLPRADLLICKHVLQHLPSADVQQFLKKQLPKYKHVLIMNGVDPITLTSDNPDIPVGAYRHLDMTKPPFNLKAAKVLTFWDGVAMDQVVHYRP
jgi:SAM-dependent methyltransferase